MDQILFVELGADREQRCTHLMRHVGEQLPLLAAVLFLRARAYDQQAKQLVANLQRKSVSRVLQHTRTIVKITSGSCARNAITVGSSASIRMGNA